MSATSVETRGSDVVVGAPTPLQAAELGLVAASVGRRCAACSIDVAVFFVLASPAVVGLQRLVPDRLDADRSLRSALDGSLWPIVLVAVGVVACSLFCLVQLLVHGRRGVTLGKAAFGLRTINVETLGRPGIWRMLVRACALVAASIVVPVVGPLCVMLSSLWDPQGRRRSWIDRIGRCWLLDVDRGVDPLDARQLRLARRSAGSVPEQVEEDLVLLATGSGRESSATIIRSQLGVVGASEHWDRPHGHPALAAAVAAPGLTALPPTRREPAAARPSEVTSAPSQASRTFQLHLDDGTQVVVPAVGVLGRSPERPPGVPEAQVIPLDDPTQQMSKTHVLFGHGDGVLWVMDVGSSNGTQVRQPDGAVRTLPPRKRIAIEAGSSIQMGGRSFAVEAVRS